jgi:hypothetical protein
MHKGVKEMNEIEQNTKKFILVGMNDAKISTSDKPIIGTDALATCIGLLLYSEEEKQAIVAHVVPDNIEAIDKVFRIILENKLHNIKFKYLIIPGYYQEHYDTIDLIKKHMTDFTPFDLSQITENAIRCNYEATSHEFAFDSSTGKFITDKVLFGTYYHMLNPEEQTITEYKKYNSQIK